MSNPHSTAPPKLEYFTPTFEPVYAGFWRRFAALLIDGIVIGVLFGLIATPIEHILPSLDPVLAHVLQSGLGIVILYLGIGIYFILMESSRLQGTLGKRLVGIRVTDMKGDRITLLRATGRTLAKVLNAGTFYVGFLIAAFTEQKQGLHDVLASTLVLVEGSETRNLPDSPG